jgi:hypothetical protein
MWADICFDYFKGKKMHEGTVSMMMDKSFPLFKAPKLRSKVVICSFLMVFKER